MTRQTELFGPGAPEAVEAARASAVKPLCGSAARVMSTESRVLFEALAGVYPVLGFDARR